MLPSAAMPPDATRRRSPDGLVALASLVSVLLVIAPVVVATLRAVANGWIPISDDAYFPIRAHDVLGGQVPLLGLATSASLEAGQSLSHPGPMLFDLLAVPVALFGSAKGTAIGVGLINTAMIVGIALVARRRGGDLLVVVAMLPTALLCWSMGSELLFDPWQPHSLLLPFLCFCFLAWGMSCGDLVLVPWAVAVGSLIVQSHVSYGYLVPVLGAWGVGALGVHLWRGRSVDGRDGADVREVATTRRRLVVVSVVTLVVFAACWAQPLWEQVAGDGNLTALVRTSGEGDTPTLGAERGLRVMSRVLATPPFWVRPSFADALAPAGHGATSGPGGVGLASIPSTTTALLSMAALALVLLACALAARRRAPSALRAVVTAGIALGMAWVTAARIPIAIYGVAAHTLRWLWPVGAFALFAVLATVVELWTRTAPARRTTVAGVVLAAATLVVVALNLPDYNAGVGPSLNRWAIPVIRDLNEQLGEHRPDGPVLLDMDGLYFLEPYSTPLLARLQELDVDFVTDDETQVRQIGTDRRYDGRNARTRVFYRFGDAALETPPNARRLALHVGLDRAEQEELDRLEASGARTPRYYELLSRWDQQTVAIFSAPITEPSR